MHEKNKYRHIPWNRYNLEKYRDTDFWSYRPALIFTRSVLRTNSCSCNSASIMTTIRNTTPPSPLNQHTSPSPLTQAHLHWIYTQNCVHYGAPWKVKHDYQLINKVNKIVQWNRIWFRLVCLHSSGVTFQTTGYIIHSKIHTSYETW